MPGDSFMQLKMFGGLEGGVVCLVSVFFPSSFKLFLLHYMIGRKSSLVITRDRENCYQQMLLLGQEVKNEI